MKKRLIYGSLLIAALVGLLALDVYCHRIGLRPAGVVAAGVVALMAATAALELAGLLTRAQAPAIAPMAALGSVAVALTPLWRQWTPASVGGADLLLVLLALVAAGTFCWQIIAYRTAQAAIRVGSTLLCVFWVGLLASATLAIRVRFGPATLILVLLATKFTDVGAYLVGSRIGRHKMIPWLSAGKSWEGLAGGILAAVGMAILLSYLLRMEPLSFIMEPWEAALLGGVLALAGQFGDFCESLIKRDAGAKDSGRLIPEFGGVLDLVDSPLTAGVAGYVMLIALLG